MNKFFTPKSVTDKCTLSSDKVLFDRRNLKKDVSINYSSCKKFIQLELEARIVDAACIELGLDSLTDESDENEKVILTIKKRNNHNLIIIFGTGDINIKINI